MSKYSNEFKQDALYMAITEGFTKAQRKYQVPQSTLRLWHKVAKDSGRLPVGYADKAPELPKESEVQSSVSLETEMNECCDEAQESDKPDAIATAMALLVIENMRLREMNHQLRKAVESSKSRNNRDEG